MWAGMFYIMRELAALPMTVSCDGKGKKTEWERKDEDELMRQSLLNYRLCNNQ